MLHGRRAAADLSRNYVNGIGYKEFAYLVDLFFGPRTPRRLLLHASVDEDYAVSPRAPGNLLQFLYEWFMSGSIFKKFRERAWRASAHASDDHDWRTRLGDDGTLDS
ncbi:MAG TPA: hypothetical protein VK638_04600 [Edaphobacter sp.]|nr:hypothetical protein [Edaphobacter sp.]